ncbi:MAG: cytochrome d ubiquinol oxidase subunit II [Thermodesulfobacteriota bacterium]
MELQAVWFFLWGLLWAVFFMTDGFDFGVGILYPFIGKSDMDRRVMVNTLGPLWDGNEVWLITAGGVTFAAFPAVYAMMFSSLYTPLMLILFALILRGVSFEFRGKIDSPAWKRMWDTCIFIGSLVPALLFGVAFANIFAGLAFDADGYHGTLFSLLTPYGLLGGVLFVLLFIVHGALWLCVKTEGPLQARAVSTAAVAWIALLCVAALFLVASAFYTPLYANYLAAPALFLIPAGAVAALAGVRLFISRRQWLAAWGSSAAAIVLCTFFGIAGLYPNLFPSRLDSAVSLTAFNASSSPMTLKIMLAVVLAVIPVVIAYQAWAYMLFRGKVTEEELEY